MKLFILTPTNPHDPAFSYDCNHGFVIAARDEHEARLIAHDQGGDEPRGCWLNPDTTTCEELLPGTESKLVMADFHAG